MSDEHLRRIESASVGDDARIRLEGKVELLEDAVALIDSARAALERTEQSSDDVGTLRELAGQLGRIDTALASLDALPDGAGAGLSSLIRSRLRALEQAHQARHGEVLVPLDERLRRAAEHIARRRTPPAPDATRFRQSRIRNELARLAGGLVLAVYLLVALWGGDEGRYPWFWVVGLAAFLITIAQVRGRAAWVLLADGFWADGQLWPLASVSLQSGGKRSARSVHFGKDVALEDDALYRLVSLMKSPQLAGLERTPSSKWVRRNDHFTVNGTLTFEADRLFAICRALGAEDTVRGEDLSTVLAHLPPARFREVGDWLSSRNLASWVSD